MCKMCGGVSMAYNENPHINMFPKSKNMDFFLVSTVAFHGSYFFSLAGISNYNLHLEMDLYLAFEHR